VSQGENTPTVTSDDVTDQPLADSVEDSSEPIDGDASLGVAFGLPDEFGGPDELDEPDGLAEAESSAADLDGDFAPAEGEGDGGGPAQPQADPADLEQESEIAADYVEGLLDVADLDGDIDMDVEGDRALVSVVGATLQELIGPRGEVLEALQELTRLAVHRQTGMRTRIMLDVGGYRAQRRSELTELGSDAAEEVKTSGIPKRLDVMTPFERKVVHDAVAAAGLRSESEGEEPHRRVVVFPAS
jgi:spoIIIJ-associated protein